MAGLFGFLAFAAFVAFIIGMIKPQLMVFWTQKKSRGMACLYLVAMIVFIGIAAAGSGGNSVPTASTSSNASVATSQPASSASNPSSSKEAQSVASTSSAESKATSESNGEGALGDYAVKIEGARPGKDYEGKPIAFVKLNFTNNSDDAQSLASSLMIEVYQKGTQLEMAIPGDDKEYNPDNYMKKVKKGVSLEVEYPVELIDKTDKLDVEVTQFLSLDDTKITKDIEIK